VAGTTGWTRAFGFRLALVVAAAAILRVLYDFVVLRHLHLGIDSTWYFLEGGVIRHDHAFADPAVFATSRAATAAWPPVYPAFLAVVRVFSGDSVRAAQLSGTVTGGATVALTGLVGRRIAGDGVGLLAAALAAVSPLLLAADGSLMSETLFVPLALATLLCALAAVRTQRIWPWIAAGACAGLAALTRAEGVLLVPFVVLPVAWRAWRHSAPRVLLATAVAGATLVLVVAPWIVRNAQRVDEPTIANVSSTTAIAGANCRQTYGGDALGSWDFVCIRNERRAVLTEAQWTSEIRREGLRYARAHASRWPVVAAARVARLWGLWDPRDQVAREQLETRSRNWQYLVAATGVVTLVLGIVGLVRLGRAGRPVEGLVGLVAIVVVVALATYGNTRFRTTAEPALLIGVAAALRPVLRRVAHRDAAVTTSRSETSSGDTAVLPSGNA
jgi:4-amino-4-deoxy-L-arabinose transferase-like glycosyltransferase